jgi:predicted cobalt transporter CbtA
MGFSDKNLNQKQSMTRCAIGFALIFVGVILLAVNIVGILFCIVGFIVFLTGYYEFCPVHRILKKNSG